MLMESGSLLIGDNTVPGVKVPREILEKIPEILQACRDFGLDFYPTIVELLTYEEISEIAAYGGFPVRYPHWRWGQEYYELSRGFENNQYRIYEMVVNCTPCYIYCLDSNTFVDHVTVIAHATGHNDFFKNNIFFAKTDQNMMNELANHGTRIRRYMSEWGPDEVSRFITTCLSIETLVDPAAAWIRRQPKERVVRVKREYQFPRRLKVDHDYMEDWINTEDFRKFENDRIRRDEIAKSIGIFKNPTKDIFGFLKDNAPLKQWQQDIIAMLYEEALYFAPQRMTKTINEGWASFCDTQIMARFGFAEGGGIFDYALHKAGVLGGKYSMNPYKLGYDLLSEIEDRWNKGKFGRDYDECADIKERESWDKKLGLGVQKVFEVRKYYDDVLLISEFFDDDFCNKYEYFRWALRPNGNYEIVDRDTKDIKNLLLKSKINGGLPEISLVDANHKGKDILLLEHNWDGRTLHPSKTKDTIKAIGDLWKRPVILVTKDKDSREIIYVCEDGKTDISYT